MDVRDVAYARRLSLGAEGLDGFEVFYISTDTTLDEDTQDVVERVYPSHHFFYKKPPCGVRMTTKRVRQAAYYAMLCGAMGHTYGCRDAWSFHVPSDQPPNRDIDTHWRDAIRFSAAQQLRHLRRLFTDHPWYALVPDQDNSLVVHGSWEANFRIQGALSEDGRYAVVYIPDDMPVWVDLNRLKGEAVDARWFNPANGEYHFIQRFHDSSVTRFYWSENANEQDHLLALSTLVGG